MFKIVDTNKLLQGQPRYEIKWLGYEKKTDLTWELKENLE